MLYAGLDLSRKRLEYCLLDDEGGRVEVGAAPPDGDGLRGFARRVELRHGAVAVRAAIESMNGARYLRWALIEAAQHACRHPMYRDRYQTTKRRLGKQRGAKVAQVDLARGLTEAIWHMLTHDQPFDPAAAGGATLRLTA